MKETLKALAPWAGVATALITAASAGGFAIDIRCAPEDRLSPDFLQRSIDREYGVDDPLPWEMEDIEEWEE